MVACSMANQLKQNTPNTGRGADPPARFASHQAKDNEANSERGRTQTKHPQKICHGHSSKTTVSEKDQKHAKNELLPPTRVRRTIVLLPVTTNCRVCCTLSPSQPLRVRSQVLVHVPTFRKSVSTIRCT